MKTIMVTGGCGFIGSNFIAHLREVGFDGRIVNVDKMTYAANVENLSEVKLGDYLLCDEDISKMGRMDLVFSMAKPDVVVNFAAESHVDRSIESASPFVMSNVVGTQVLLDMAVRHDVRRFIQISTDEVYGDLGEDGSPSVETDLLCPSSPYSASKAAGDHLALAYARTHGLDVVVTRCSNNYGPRQYPEKLIPVVIGKAIANEEIPVYARGQNVRDWIHVTDHCRGIWQAVTKGKAGQIYNFGGASERRNLEVVRGIIDIVGSGRPVFVADRAGHDFRYAINYTKATREIGWEPKIVFEDGLRQTVKWYSCKGP